MTSGNTDLDKYMKGKLGQNANPYPGPMSAQINPMMTGAANMMSMYGTGQPYQAPGVNTYASLMGQGGALGGAGGAGGMGGGQQGGQSPQDIMGLIQQLLAQQSRGQQRRV
jgi:hypothetical protein